MRSSSYEQRKTALIEEITAAFDGVSREQGVTLHEATVIDDYGSLEERALARTQDTEDKWQNVPDEDIRFTDAVLSFLDPKGFCGGNPCPKKAFLKKNLMMLGLRERNFVLSLAYQRTMRGEPWRDTGGNSYRPTAV